MGRKLLGEETEAEDAMVVVDDPPPTTQTTMKRRRDQLPLFDVGSFEHGARQTEIVDPALTRVKAAGLSRMTWVDYVQMGDGQKKAKALPAWKLRYSAGDRLLLHPAHEGDPRVVALVRYDMKVPDDFDLPVLVFADILLDGVKVTETMVPADAIKEHTHE